MRNWIPFLLMTALATACTSKPQGSVRKVEPREAVGLLRNGFAVLIDVRETNEVGAEGVAQGAHSLPYSAIVEDDPQVQALISSSGRDKEFIFYDSEGERSAKAAKHFAEKGLRAGDMGKLSDWKAAGLPLESKK